MTKITLQNVAFTDSTSTLINANSAEIETKSDTFLSRDGTTPNAMLADLDMNSNNIINLPVAVDPTSPVRLQEFALVASGGSITIPNLTAITFTAGAGLTGGGTLASNRTFDVGAGTGITVNANDVALDTTNGRNKLHPTTTVDNTIARYDGTGGDIQTSSVTIDDTNNVAGTGYIELNEVSAPAAPGADKARLYAKDVSGTTQLFYKNASAEIAIAGGAVLKATDNGVTGDGSTNDASAINTFLTTAATAGLIAYFPGGLTYECGSTSISVPDNSMIICGRNATFRRSAYPASGSGASGAFIKMANRVNWTGGILTNTVTFGTSSTSNTIAVASITWTVSAGLDIHVNDFVRAYRTSAPATYAEGTVTAYSGTSLTINCTFTNGSGTFSDWTFVSGHFHNTAMYVNAGSYTNIYNVEATGRWYLGYVLDGGSVTAASTTSYCSVNNCIAAGPMNRGFYMYEDVARCSFNNCTSVSTTTLPMDYGFNYNAANPSVANNSVRECSTVGCNTTGTYFQGFGAGDQINECSWVNCVAGNVLNTAGNGFSLFFANVAIPQFCTVTNCTAKFCGNDGFLIAGAAYCHLSNCFARSNTTAGFQINTSTSTPDHNMFTACAATANGTGFLFSTGNNNMATGCRSTANTTNVTNTSTALVISGTGGAITVV